MAKIHQSVLGAVTGRIGPVTGYTRNGTNILRTARNTGTVKATPARLAQREKIRICNEFTHAFSGTGFFNTTFPAYGHTGSGYNRVTGSLMNLAVSGSYPGQYLSWPKVLIARGPLPGAEDLIVARDSTDICLFSWADNGGTGTARDTDKVILVAYCPEKRQAIYSLDAGIRKAEQAILDLSGFEREEVVTWISFINEHGDVADSVFGGRI